MEADLGGAGGVFQGSQDGRSSIALCPYPDVGQGRRPGGRHDVPPGQFDETASCALGVNPRASTVQPLRASRGYRENGPGRWAGDQPYSVLRCCSLTSEAPWVCQGEGVKPVGEVAELGLDSGSGEQESVLVGLDGLEPSTSSLSGMRSDRLSYRPLRHVSVPTRWGTRNADQRSPERAGHPGHGRSDTWPPLGRRLSERASSGADPQTYTAARVGREPRHSGSLSVTSTPPTRSVTML